MTLPAIPSVIFYKNHYRRNNPMMNNKSTVIFSVPLDFFNKRKFYEGIKNCDYLMAYAKQVAYALGKMIVPSPNNSVRMLNVMTEH